MSSVTGRIKQINQPYGGYIKPSSFKKIIYEDNKALFDDENIHGSIIGMCVDYLTRYKLDGDAEKAFEISLIGYERKIKYKGKRELKKDQKERLDAWTLLNDINGLDDDSIISACKLCTYDVWLRNPTDAELAKTAKEINPDLLTIENIRIMVERSIRFWLDYGPIIANGFTFEPGGYTSTVDSGDGDYITEDTIWDFKVKKSKIRSQETLQLAMYWIMGIHSKKRNISIH